MTTTGSTNQHPRSPPASQNTRTPSVAVFDWDGCGASRSQWESRGGGASISRRSIPDTQACIGMRGLFGMVVEVLW
ncbi:MAG: hypothetical protein K8R08_09095 [Methanosarcinales archaeon]|nr:hypothetical protein [Methanosarcinales archaeon]